MQVRSATVADAADAAVLYTEHVLHGVATFDTAPRTVDEWAEIIRQGRPGHEFLVACDGSAFLGYAKSGTFRDRPAYASTVELAVYVTTPGRGVGDALFGALLPRLDAGPAHLAVSNIALPNAASVRLHEKHGFVPAGTLREVGHKLGGWRDVGTWQRPLGWSF